MIPNTILMLKRYHPRIVGRMFACFVRQFARNRVLESCNVRRAKNCCASPNKTATTTGWLAAIITCHLFAVQFFALVDASITLIFSSEKRADHHLILTFHLHVIHLTVIIYRDTRISYAQPSLDINTRFCFGDALRPCNSLIIVRTASLGTTRNCSDHQNCTDSSSWHRPRQINPRNGKLQSLIVTIH